MNAPYRYALPRTTPVDVYRKLTLEIPGLRANPKAAQLFAPLHAGWLVSAALTAREIPSTLHTTLPAWGGDWMDQPSWGAVVSKLHRMGEVRPGVLEPGGLVLERGVLPYQQAGICFAAAKAGAHLWWPGGAGKTLALILWAMLKPGPVVVVTKAAARMQWASEVRRFTELDPYVVAPDTKETLANYLFHMEGCGKRPFVIVAWSSLVKHVDALLQVRAVSIGFDELHIGKSHRRKRAVTTDDGGVRFEDLDNAVSAAARLSRSAVRRLGTSATPVKDRLRDLWGQLDLVEPGAWGPFLVCDQETRDPIGGFAYRYCAARRGVYSIDTTGTSNLQELLGRLQFCVHKLTYAETHRDLPPKRRRSLYLRAEDQDRATLKDRKRFDQDMRRAAKFGSAAVLEARLAESAALKRSAVVGLAVETGQARGKVVIFTGRTEDADALLLALRKSSSGIFTGSNSWCAHGKNTTPEQREKIREAYMAAPGPAVLVSLGQAMGTAYNLHDTDHAIFAMLPWTGGDLHQWEQRFSRQGMLRKVLITYVVNVGSVDEHVVARLVSKLPAMEEVAGDAETARAQEALSGMEDREALASAVLAKLEQVDADLLDDD